MLPKACKTTENRFSQLMLVTMLTVSVKDPIQFNNQLFTFCPRVSWVKTTCWWINRIIPPDIDTQLLLSSGPIRLEGTNQTRGTALSLPPTAHLVLKGRCETVVEHLLVEDWGDAARHGRHDPHPVARAAAPHPVLILHVLHERLGGRVMVHDGHFACLAGGTNDRTTQKLN